MVDARKFVIFAENVATRMVAGSVLFCEYLLASIDNLDKFVFLFIDSSFFFSVLFLSRCQFPKISNDTFSAVLPPPSSDAKNLRKYNFTPRRSKSDGCFIIIAPTS